MLRAWALILCTLLASCGSMRKLRDKASIAETATIRLFAKIDESDADAIHLMFDANLRLSHPIEKVRTIFGKIHEEAGICDTPRTQNWSAATGLGAALVTLVATARCEKQTVAARLVWTILGDQPVLTSFSFSSHLGSSEFDAKSR